jgi:uncharacterized metal-binding protein YceD (DUF177 family)
MKTRQTSNRASSSGQASTGQVWSVPVAVEDIPETGRRIELAPDANTRAAIAKLAGVAGVPRLTAGFDLTRHGRDGLRILGSVSATVDQTCVVTLEAIQSEIEEPVDVVFVPPESTDRKSQRPLPADAEEPPETMQGGVVDLGAVATEFLLLGIDPYPRKPGAVFDAPAAGDPAVHPFAALASLKNG